MITYFYLIICLSTTCFCCERPTFSANKDTSLKCEVKARIDSGWVCGRVREAEAGVQYASFRGIPYAKQPLHELRFKELKPLDPWPNVRLATEEGPICPQYDEIYGRMARPVGMSESCILANVHVPLAVPGRRSKDICQKTGLPILVFIHGGGFQVGSGDSDIHGPEYLVSKEVILITFNYRLNVFGFLSLNSAAVPGNNGLRDAITLLKWVQRNARAFGGDPDNVTLAGQSTGSVAAHLVALSEASVGLLKRVILLSGVGNGGFYTASPAYAQTIATSFLEHVERPTFSANKDTSLKCEVKARIDSGWVCGRVREAEAGVQYASFRGIPYAKQPLHELRFKELKPLDPWPNVRLATEEGPICPQYDEIYGRMARPVGMSESCILANVHVPLAVPGRRSKDICQKTGLPILVFIHGGGFQVGSGDSDIHGPEYLVSKEVILITFNYRLNVFGFLSLNSAAVPGNNGLRDAITLLKWVQRNARAFGGDPDNVTLAGQSTGSVAAHLVALSEASVGLLKRVILLSGVGNGGFYTASPAYAQTIATSFLEHVGINATDADEIHKQLIHMPLEKIMEANRIVQFTIGLLSFVPVAEAKHSGVSRVLDDYPEKLIKLGRGKDLPMIVGTTSIECEYFKRRIKYLDLAGSIEQNPVVALPVDINYSVSESIALSLAEILIGRYYEGGVTVDKIIKYCTSAFFSYPAFKLAEWRAAQGAAPLYKYIFAFDSDFNVVKFGRMLTYEGGGAHVEDQTFVLRVNSLLDQDEKSFPPRTRDDLMKHWMTSFVVNFMRCSHPLCDNQSGWPATDEKLNYQLINEPVRIYNNVNMTTAQRDMKDFYDNLYEMAGF